LGHSPKAAYAGAAEHGAPVDPGDDHAAHRGIEIALRALWKQP
jgi:hypothetical protein